MKRWLPLVVLVGLVVAALIVGRGSSSNSPAARASRIESEVRCPVCEGQSVLESDHPEARAVRQYVSDQIAAGASNGEIERGIVDRFGKDMSLRPAATGIAGLVWILPVVAFAIAIAGLTLAFRRWRTTIGARASDDDRELVERALHDG